MNPTTNQTISEKVINEVVDRFLQWKLPDDFNPDCGIHFDADAAKKLNPRNLRYEPTGTNLFSATQAREMVRNILGSTLTDIAAQAREDAMRFGADMAVDYILKHVPQDLPTDGAILYVSPDLLESARNITRTTT